jgi:hypothetical protein
VSEERSIGDNKVRHFQLGRPDDLTEIER